MEQRHLGRTGLRVSRLGLGTMTWSRDTDEHDATEQLRDFTDAGGTLVDTSASYADGGAEELLGELLDDVVPRDEVVLCTKAGIRRTSDRRGGRRLPRRRCSPRSTARCAASRTDHVDLWLVQTPDPRTPLDETVSALRLAVTSGRARYVGLANHAGWQVARAASLLEGEVGLTAVEAEYSLLQRGIEREVVPAAVALGVGVLAWSPLGAGVLTGKYRRTIPADSRAASPHLAGFVEPYLARASATIVEAVATAADRARAHPARGRARVGAEPRGRVGDRRRPHGRPAAGVARGDRTWCCPTSCARRSTRSAPRALGYPERF